MDEATVELIAIDVVPKVAEVGFVGEFPVAVITGPVIPKVFLKDRVGDVECPAFSFVGCCFEVDYTLCRENLSEPIEHLSFFVIDVNEFFVQDTGDGVYNVVLVGRGFVCVLINFFLRRMLNPREDFVKDRHLFLFRQWSGGR